jgi:hypothetical protein
VVKKKNRVYGINDEDSVTQFSGEHLIRCGHGLVSVSGVAVHENRKTLDGRWDMNGICLRPWAPFNPWKRVFRNSKGQPKNLYYG